jgi:hypothetical protein
VRFFKAATQRQTQSSSSSASNKSWTLTTILPAPYRTSTILPPPRAPSSFTEATYIGLYTFIISLITLSGGSIPEQKLDRYLRRVNADSYTPIDRTDALLARLVKDGYLIKNRDVDGGEEVIEYFVGARGKIEVGDMGVAGLTKKVYGFEEEEGGGGPEREEFDAKLKRSLGLKEMAVKKDENGVAASASGSGSGNRDGGGRKGHGNARGRRHNDDEDMEDESD